ncbi:hypothetical protein LG314_11070 [Agrococcus terreus]|uniref:hypothetical protein n=1 Tax=Agrococcus terreus TaxID=574649 RepID=UPI00384D338F
MAATAGFRARVVRLALASGAASIGAVGIGLLLGGSAASASEDEPRGLLSGIVHDVAHTAGSGVEAVLEPVDQVLHEVDRGLRPVEAAVRPVAEPVVRPVAPVVERVLDVPAQVAAPAASAVEPVVDPVVDTVRPVVAPVVAPLEPVTTPVRELVGDVVDPVVGTVDRAVGALPLVDDLLGEAPVRGVVEPVVDAVAPVVDAVAPAPGAGEPGAGGPGAGGPGGTDPDAVAPVEAVQDAGDPADAVPERAAPDADGEADALRPATSVPLALRAVGPIEPTGAPVAGAAAQERALVEDDGHDRGQELVPAPSGAPTGSSGSGGGAAASAADAADHLELAIACGEAGALEHDRTPGSLAEEPGSSPD